LQKEEKALLLIALVQEVLKSIDQFYFLFFLLYRQNKESKKGLLGIAVCNSMRSTPEN